MHCHQTAVIRLIHTFLDEENFRVPFEFPSEIKCNGNLLKSQIWANMKVLNKLYSHEILQGEMKKFNQAKSIQLNSSDLDLWIL